MSDETPQPAPQPQPPAESAAESARPGDPQSTNEPPPAEKELSVPPPAADTPPRPRRRWLRRLFLLFLLFVFLTAGGLGAGYWYLEQWGRRPYGAPGVHPFKIEPRTQTRQIARRLRDGGLVENDLLFLAWMRLHGRRRGLQAGQFTLQTPISPARLIDALGRGTFEKILTIPEGWTARQIAHRLKAEGWIPNEQLWLDLVARPAGPELLGEPLPRGAEGFCFPDTYRLDAGTSAGQILRRMQVKFKREWTLAEPARRDERSRNLSLPEVVTLASMVEREARTDQEMPAIASVYLNRLARGMKLQCCATVRYAMGEVWDRPLFFADLKIDSPYNTYLHPGLPPGPIANPGRAALEAVLRPAPTDFLFYVYAGNHHHVFSHTYAEHMKAVREARKRAPHESIQEQSQN